MVPPLLKLEFTAGPRAGDSLRFKPGTVRVGRIVYGNEIAIKDAGISSKHLRIVSDSGNWKIHDLGSSNGTFLNSEAIDPETPVDLSHGDVIKLGEYTTIVVNFVNDDKLPPNKRVDVSDPIELDQEKPKRRGRPSKQEVTEVPDKRVDVSDPIELDQEKPKRRGRPSKQKVTEVPVRTRASRKRILEDIDEELEFPIAKKVNSRVGRPRKNAIIKEEEVPKAPECISRVRKGKNSESEDTVVEKRTEIGVDGSKRVEQVEIELRTTSSIGEDDLNSTVREDGETENLQENENEVQGDCSERIEDRCDKEDEREGDGSKRVEQVVIGLRTKSSIGEDELNCTVREDRETENIQDVEEENENEVQGDCSTRSDDNKEDEREGDGSKRVEKLKIELTKKSTVDEHDMN